MDARQYQSIPRQQDANNSVPPSSQSHSGYYQTSPSHQPSIQMPYSDPFQRPAPDPFMPNAQHHRRDSYGVQSNRDSSSATPVERATAGNSWPNPSASTGPPSTSISSSHLPPPPPVSSAHGSSNTASSYPYDSSRRRSLGGSPPRPGYYATGHSENQSPSSFGSRHMPPPSPSQQQPPATSHGGSRQAPGPPYSSGRELPSLGSSHKSGGGMSISSILGTDAPSQPPPSKAQHSPSSSNQSPVVSTMRPPSPRRGQSAGSRMELGQWRRPQTPEKHAGSLGMRTAESTAYPSSTSSLGQHFATSSRASPEHSRAPPSQSQHLYHHSAPRPPPRYHQYSPPETHDRRIPDDRPPPRPSSQPVGFAPPRENDHREHEHSSSGSSRQQPYYTSSFTADGKSNREDPRSAPTPSYVDRPNTTVASDRVESAQPLSHTSSYSPPRDQRLDGTSSMHRGGVGRDALRDEPAREYATLRKDEYSAQYRPGYRGQYYNSQSQTPVSMPPMEAPRSHPQGLDPYSRQQQENLPHTSQDPGSVYMRPHHSQSSEPPADKHREELMTPLANDGLRTYEPQQPRRQGGEDMQQSRSFLGINDPNRRGRASPLPQAVQGAQAQLVGPGTDPSIKSEFGRIFQGLGSGLGGHIPGNLTPSRQSPLPQRMMGDDSGPITLSDNDGVKMTRIGSARGPRGLGRRVKDEESRTEADPNDGRGTLIGSGGRGAKRTKMSHHHTASHHHHLHHHQINNIPNRNDDENNPFISKLGPGVQTAAPATSTTHHHHISSNLHPLPTVPTAPPMQKPTIEIFSQAVLDSVESKPRYHLGSALYEVNITTPPLATTPMHDKFGYFSQYKAARRFTEEDENCTFTIRIPRSFLTAAAREKICVDRYLYGSDVYTDDSDPIAAAIHSGWIRGEWGEDIDTNLMDLPPLPTDDNPPGTKEMNAVPKNPVVPPPKLDAHITIIVLPPLTEYACSLRFGVKSRKWGGNPDGFSFMIQSIRWVDEGLSRGIGRTGAARRKRLRAEYESAKGSRRLISGELGSDSRSVVAGVGA